MLMLMLCSCAFQNRMVRPLNSKTSTTETLHIQLYLFLVYLYSYIFYSLFIVYLSFATETLLVFSHVASVPLSEWTLAQNPWHDKHWKCGTVSVSIALNTFNKSIMLFSVDWTRKCTCRGGRQKLRVWTVGGGSTWYDGEDQRTPVMMENDALLGMLGDCYMI